MRRISMAALLLLASLLVKAQNSDTLRHEVALETSMGRIVIALYNETPRHRDNMMKLVKEKFYDGLLFHRVINRFMIQTGDSASRHAKPGELLGNSSESRRIPAEIRFPKLFHKRGAVGAARSGDAENPERESSESQFYIVYGRRFNDDMLDKEQARLDEATGRKVKLSPEVREVYKNKGGSPHLDGQYTVFGEVVEGLDVVEAIQCMDTDKNDRPLQDVKIINAEILR